MTDDAGGKPEIIIVRRRGGDDAGGGKAGAWKIAYADFVTAMMAFFLVMWLINASNEKTRAQVASYFNPIKLTDTSTGARSLKDVKENRNQQRAEKRQSEEGSPPSEKDVESEATLMASPPESLDRLKSETADLEFRSAGLKIQVEIAPAVKPDTSNPGVGDPFDPQAWDKVRAETPADVVQNESKKMEENLQNEGEQAPEAPKSPQSWVADSEGAEQSLLERGTSASKSKQDDSHKLKEDAAAISAEIASKLGTDLEDLKRSFSVVPTTEGILISLTERENFEMFETGSAEPRQETMKLVQAIAAAVQSRNGNLVIRGHTDSRPYRNRYYDNWQLSTARAHFARYMLIRAGLDDARIKRIEGVADREPRNREDPQAAENRRIDILIGGAEQ